MPDLSDLAYLAITEKHEWTDIIVIFSKEWKY